MIFVQVCLQVHSSYIKHKQKILNEMPIMKNYILDCSQLKKEKKLFEGHQRKIGNTVFIYVIQLLLIFYLGETLNVD